MIPRSVLPTTTNGDRGIALLRTTLSACLPATDPLLEPPIGFGLELAENLLGVGIQKHGAQTDHSEHAHLEHEPVVTGNQNSISGLHIELLQRG